MNKIINYKKEIMIMIALIVGVSMHDGSTLIGWLGTIGLIAGFANVYLTTKRSKWFVIPDFVWITSSLASLALTNNYSDMVLYMFYIFVGLWQFYNWSTNKDEAGKTIIARMQFKHKWESVVSAIGLTVIIALLTVGSSNVLLGAITSGFGIVGSYYLAQRYYESELLFVISNMASVTVLLLSGLYQLSLIPLCFLLFNVIFLTENAKGSEEQC